MTQDRLTKECQRIMKSQSWFPYYFERLENGVLCKGAQYPLITRGPRKGEPNFRKPIKGTEGSVVVSFRENVDAALNK
jgi:hypothetical protein